MDAFLDWLANHEPVGVCVVVLLLGIFLFYLVFWVFRGDLPSLDDEDDEFGEGGRP